MSQINIKQNKIHSNIFDESQYKLIYDTISACPEEKTFILKIYAQKVWHTSLPGQIKDRVEQLAKEIYNDNVKLEEISFARYSKQYGELPNLTPHYDNTFKEHRVTLDVQLRSNCDWPIIVEGKSFTLKDNQALTFSGTDQIHWRDYKKLPNDFFVEMLFCHFSLPGKDPITFDDIDERERQMMYHSNRFFIELIDKAQNYI